jgi:hypothetical protein
MNSNYLAPLEQLKSLLSGFSNEEYTQKISVLNGSSVGQHTRHIVEFYECLFASLETGTVNYDARQRKLQIEQEVDFTLNTIEQMLVSFKAVTSKKKVYLDVDNSLIDSSIERELFYLSEHTIHHLAIIRIGLQEELPNVKFCSNLGIAPSTIKHRELVLSED